VRPRDDLVIGRLVQADRRAAVSLLATAFCDQPLDRAVVGGRRARRLRASRAGMQASLEAAADRAELRTARVATGLAGVLVALPPFVHPLPPPAPITQLRTLLLQGFRAAGRWREVYEALEAHRPDPDRWFLSLLAVAPGLQGQGIGSALLSSWLRDVDQAAQPAWLETSRGENVSFYRRQGFRVREELWLHGVPVWLMERPAASGWEGLRT
jgi:ribosomal protein S18 acetylase RimI-like enzyme